MSRRQSNPQRIGVVLNIVVCSFFGAGLAHAQDVTYPPRLPGGKTIVTDTSPDFLKPTTDLLPGTTIAKTAPKIDFLYLDGLDAFLPGSHDFHLRAVKAALPKMSEQGLILFDDVHLGPNGQMTNQSKGNKAIPFLEEKGWERVFHEYGQCLLARQSTKNRLSVNSSFHFSTIS